MVRSLCLAAVFVALAFAVVPRPAVGDECGTRPKNVECPYAEPTKEQNCQAWNDKPQKCKHIIKVLKNDFSCTIRGATQQDKCMPKYIMNMVAGPALLPVVKLCYTRTKCKYNRPAGECMQDTITEYKEQIKTNVGC